MEILRTVLRNFWFCLMLAVFSLLTLSSAILEGGTFWIVLAVFNVVYWVFAAYRTTKPSSGDDAPLTDEQTAEIRKITQRFSRDLGAILQEAKDNESNRRKDQEADKKQSDDE